MGQSNSCCGVNEMDENHQMYVKHDVTNYLKDGCDANEQDENGNTPLHRAISSDASINVLRNLLQKGASVTVTNQKFLNPLECINHGSVQTALNLHKLEKEFDFKYDDGRTLFHWLLDENYRFFALSDNEQKATVEQFWEAIVNDMEQFGIDPNVQDKYGNTPLHIAAKSCISSSQHMLMLLSHFPNIDPFLVNHKGNTFLHEYFSRSRVDELYPDSVDKLDSEFTKRLLQGDLKACPRPVMKQLLNCQNKLKETPIHAFAQIAHDNNVTVDVFRCFAAAGADFNIPNIVGDTVLHCLIHGRRVHGYFDDDFRLRYFLKPGEENIRNDCIKFIVKNGADIGKKNNMGEPPLFVTDRVNTISILLDNGAKVDERNRLNQTALLSYMCKSGANIDIIKVYLERGADVNARDKHGSSALHYAAWHDVGQDSVDSLMNHGATLQPDSLNQLPCDVAHRQGSKIIFDKGCKCKDGLYKGKKHFNFKTTAMEHSKDLERVSQHFEVFRGRKIANPLNMTGFGLVRFDYGLVRFNKEAAAADLEAIMTQAEAADVEAKVTQAEAADVERVTQHFEVFRGRNIAHLLNMPGFGLVRFDGEAEAANVEAAVTEGIRKICEEIGKEDKWLSCTLIKSGSVGEMTKVGLPDEFDFVCVFDKLSEVCDIDEQNSSIDPGFACLKLKPEYSNKDCIDLFDKNGYLCSHLVRIRFLDILESKRLYFSIECNSNLSYIGVKFKINKPTFQFTLQWTGAFYKNIIINIDIVPACQIKGFWPEKANLNALECDVQTLKDEGSLIIMQNKKIPHEIPLRISALRAEQRHMQSIPSIAKEAYVLSKILCDNRICSTLHNQKYVKVKNVITSYMLKTCMFHVHHTMSVSNKNESMYDVNKVDVDRYNEALYRYALQIYQTFLKYSEDEVLPSFIFPWQNVFTFVTNNFDVSEELERCVKRRIFFANMILYILGENKQFTHALKQGTTS